MDQRNFEEYLPDLFLSPNPPLVHISYKQTSTTFCGNEIKEDWKRVDDGTKMTCKRCLKAIPHPAIGGRK